MGVKNMKNKSLIFLVLSLGISSGTSLINRFLVPIPNWLGIVLILISGISLIISIRLYLKNKHSQ